MLSCGSGSCGHILEILSPVIYLQQKHSQSQVSKNGRNPNCCKLICEPEQCMLRPYNEYLQEQKSFPSSSKGVQTSRMSGLNWKKSMHKEERTLRLATIMELPSCRRGLKQNHLDKQLQRVAFGDTFSQIIHTHANELSKRLCCFYTVIISGFKCLGGVWKLWAKGNLVE